jgi:hypothetical protein
MFLSVYLPPDRVIRAEYTTPALADTSRNERQAQIFENINAAHGTPALLVTPRKPGALPLRAMNRTVRDATYSELFPAEMTEITIRALMRWAAGRIPASVKAIVSGELAVLDPCPSRRGSL